MLSDKKNKFLLKCLFLKDEQLDKEAENMPNLKDEFDSLITETVSKIIVPFDQTNLGVRLLNKNAFFNKKINDCFIIGQLTEVYGESGTGKTRLCMQLCLMIQAIEVSPLFHKSQILYISTERGFRSEVLYQCHQTLKSTYKSLQKIDPGENVFVVNIFCFQEQETFLTKKLPKILKQNKKIKLVIIDSIGSNYRGVFHKTSYKETASFLKKISVSFRLFILCTTHVSSITENNIQKPREYFSDIKDKIVTEEDILFKFRLKNALGQTWTSELNNQIFFTKRRNSPSCNDINRSFYIMKNYNGTSIGVFVIKNGLINIEKESETELPLEYTPA